MTADIFKGSCQVLWDRSLHRPSKAIPRIPPRKHCYSHLTSENPDIWKGPSSYARVRAKIDVSHLQSWSQMPCSTFPKLLNQAIYWTILWLVAMKPITWNSLWEAVSPPKYFPVGELRWSLYLCAGVPIFWLSRGKGLSLQSPFQRLLHRDLSLMETNCGTKHFLVVSCCLHCCWWWHCL